MATLLPGKFTEWLNARQKTSVHRQLLVISGQDEWVNTIAEATIAALEPDSIASVGFNINLACQADSTHITNKSYRQYLGQEFDLLVYNGFDGVRANAMMALSGTVKAGGLMILLCPDLASWPHMDDPQRAERTSYGYGVNREQDRFVKWLTMNISQSSEVALLSELDFRGLQSPISFPPSRHREAPYKTDAQKSAVESIFKVLTGHRKRPLVLTADRGRGKSSSLGIAAGLLAQQGKKLDIVITAPRFTATEQVFKHAKLIAPDLYQRTKQCFENSTTRLRFEASDTLLAKETSGDLLFIDEAAALPYDIISKLTNKFSRVVLSTTLHGYEGSGRGFEIRFKQFLNTYFPGWKSLHMDAPIRWSEGDSLERFWFRTMLMDVQSPIPGSTSGPIEKPIYSEIMPEELLAKPELFKQVFQLLVNAHYQTEPDDLSRLLDSDDVKLFIACVGENVVSVAMVAEEGGLKLHNLSDDIASGKRRPNGHLMAQSLAYGYAEQSLATLHYWRIVRIAVHPDWQRKGIASELINTIRNNGRQARTDVIGTSFGMTTALCTFWRRNQFIPVKVGYKKDAASGEQNILMLEPLTDSAREKISSVREQFSEEVEFQTTRNLRELAPELLSFLYLNNRQAELKGSDGRIVEQFIDGSRPLNACEKALFGLLLASSEELPDIQQAYVHLTASVAQKRSVDELKGILGVSGKKELEKLIRGAAETLYTALQNKKGS